MALPARIDGARVYGREAARELLLWTTRDGREIPLDEMSDEHVANAVRLLSLWRARLKKRGGDEAILSDLKAAITRFKALQRRRRKQPREARDEANAKPSRLALPKPMRAKSNFHKAGPQSSPAASRPTRWGRPRKPVAST